MYKYNRFDILCIFSGAGKIEMYKQWLRGLKPDSSLYGFNYFLIKNINVRMADISYFFSKKFENKIRQIFGFNAIFYCYFWSIIQSDYVFASTALHMILFTAPFRFFSKTRWYVYNMNLNNLLGRHSGIKKSIILKSLKLADGIICLSSQQKNILIKNGLQSNKIEVVKFGIDKYFFKASSQDDGYILSVGKDNGRDYETLFKAFSDSKYRVVVVCLERNLVGLTVPDNFDIRYNLSYSEVLELYTKAKMVVVPAKNELNFFDGSDCSGQMSILDAMACAKPVLATYRAWMDDYFINNHNIFILPPEDPVALIKRVDEIFYDDALLKKVSINGRKLIDAELNSEFMANKILNIIKKRY
jgi:glycosyltransferase involved in cell wall biosynthesis